MMVYVKVYRSDLYKSLPKRKDGKRQTMKDVGPVTLTTRPYNPKSGFSMKVRKARK